MAIPPVHAHRLIYHFTHIDNLPNLLKTGFLCNNHPDFPENGCTSIAESGIQVRRSQMDVSCAPGGKVHDYVPLYFGSRSPMLLAVIQKKNVDQQDIIYFEFPIALIERNDVVFTSASANTNIPPTFYSDPSNLQNLNWSEIDSLKWTSATDALKQQRMAEVLVHSNLAIQQAKSVVVWNEGIKQRVEAIVSKAGASFPPIIFDQPGRHHYFVVFKGADAGRSIVTGPRLLAARFKAARQQMAQAINKSGSAPFASLKQLLENLRSTFGCIPQTAELVDLKSANGIHKETVDVHTRHVVENVKALPEFKGLSAEYQDVLELAAYLHDIGKGPKARWADNGGLQKVDPDHPVLALPMVVDILTQQVRQIDEEQAFLVLKLVAYHDLVGEVLGKGRDEQQIIDVVGSKLELDMLFALGKADATSLVEWWWNDFQAAALYARCLTGIDAKGKAVKVAE